MSYALYIPVKETVKELRTLLRTSSPIITPRIRMLLEMRQAGQKGVSKRALMDAVGASSQSIHNWRSAYKQGGMETLVYNGRKDKVGKPSVFTMEEHRQIEQKLKDPKNGLAGYIELKQWIEQEFKKDVKYNTVLKYARHHFGSGVKVARKSHVKKDGAAVAAFKKNFTKEITDRALAAPICYTSINLYFQDESRFGLHTKYGRGLTAKGIQPVCTFQQVFQYTYLFGAFSPVTGSQFLLEMPNCNADNFQLFLNEFSAQQPHEYKIIVLDNGAFHKAKCLVIPGNITLLFLPPYSPELNPAEKIWQHFKRKFTNQLYNTLEQISEFFTQTIGNMTPKIIKSICAYSYFSLNSFWSV